MKLVVVSHVIHYRHEGRLHAYGPYAREIEIWAELFEELVIASPLRHEAPPKDSIPFEHSNISIEPQLETGGDTAMAKAWQLLTLPLHVWKLGWAMASADAIHVRCPGNLGLLGALLAPALSSRIVAKYAGDWYGMEHVSPTFKLQRRILSSAWWRRGIVTVYGDWPNQPSQVVPFFTSMMTEEQVRTATQAAAGKALSSPIQILYTGRLVPKKGVDLLLRAVQVLTQEGFPLKLTIVGDGEERSGLEQLASELGIQNSVTFRGAVAYEQVMEAYRHAHILVLASLSEGWPKAVAEAMCHGVVCVGGANGLLPWMLQDRGVTVPLGNADALAAAIRGIAEDPARFKTLSLNASQWAQAYSLEGLKEKLRTVLSHAWNVPLPQQIRSDKTVTIPEVPSC
jgi:glycosyltransferase involved in cell wall biosynthesis